MDFTALIWQLTAIEWLFYFFCAYRYGRLIINCFAHWSYQSMPKADKPTFTSQDVTVIVPTIENDMQELDAPIRSILACNPAELILVTTNDRYERLVAFTSSFKDARVKVYQSRIANKRLQLRQAIPYVTTAITVLVDDDVTWPKTALPWILAPFEQPKYGSVGVCQKVRRMTSGSIISRCWNWLGADYIERRNFEISATHFVDGGTSCMSGRTNALRTQILQDPLFLLGFCDERWGKYHLNADDDNFVTRWLVSHGWKTWIQYNDECMIETTLENNPKFLKQCLRWARSNWRSNWTTLFVEGLVWRKQIYSTYAIYFATFSSLGFISDPLFFFLYHLVSESWAPNARHLGWYMVVAWYLFTKVVKRVGLLRRTPSDVVYIPVSIIFGFCHGFIKLYALWTWNVTSWGSRPDGDTHDNERMTPQLSPSEFMTNPIPGNKGLIRYTDESTATEDKHDKAVHHEALQKSD